MDASIHFSYRLMFTTIEPLMAVLGATNCFLKPSEFAATAIPSHPKVPSDLNLIFIWLASSYYFLSFVLSIVLRVTSELRVWQAVLAGVLMCDAGHMYGIYTALGPKTFWNPSAWSGSETMHITLLGVTAAMRVAFMFGVGIQPFKSAIAL